MYTTSNSLSPSSRHWKTRSMIHLEVLTPPRKHVFFTKSCGGDSR